MDSSAIAVVMPAYNASRFIQDAIRGVLGQTHKNLMLFVVDDCSTDDTISKIEEIKDSRIVLIKRDINGGVSEARNSALSSIHNRGFRHIAFCDSDDIWNPDHLEILIVSMRISNADMVYSKPALRFDNGQPAVAFGIADYPAYPGKHALIENNFIYISGVVIRPIVAKLIGNFDSSLDGIEDWDYWVRVAELGLKIHHVTQKTFTYIIKTGGGMGAKGQNKHELFRLKHPKSTQSSSMQKVSIVIPTHKHIEELKSCVESVLANSKHTNLQIIVVANGCGDDGTVEYISSRAREYPSLNLLDFDQALGYTKATNEGLKAATGDYVILLNNDTVILGKDWIDILLKPMLEDPTVGITAPSVVHSYDANHHFAIFFCACISRKALDSVGPLLDESFSPGGGEDIAFSIEAVRKGFKIVRVPDKPLVEGDGMMIGAFPIYHKGEATMHDEEHREKWELSFKLNMSLIRQRYNMENK
jgi:glycosyltransferase involved in cell wall biosynthesis